MEIVNSSRRLAVVRMLRLTMHGHAWRRKATWLHPWQSSTLGRLQVSPMGTPGEPRQIVNVEYKMLIGADGRSSTVRRCLEDQVEGMAFEQATDQLRR